MANINLATETSSEEKFSMTTNGIIIIFIVLVLVLSLYGFLIWGRMQADKDIAKTQEEFQSQSTLLASDKAVQVVDFHNRLEIAKSLISQSADNREMLGEIEKAIVPGVYLSSYRYNDGQKIVSLNCVADNYNTIAKQILSFKKSTFFSGVSLGGNNSSQETKQISYEINLQLK